MSDTFYLESAHHPAIFVRIHLPTNTMHTQRIVCVASTVGSEYYRLAVVLKDWTQLLCHHGYTVIHFDPPGAGQSQGHLKEVTLTEWIESMKSILIWIRSQYPHASSIDAVALRWTALWAPLAFNAETGLRNFYLWNPVTNASERIRLEIENNHRWHERKTLPEKEGLLGEIWNPQLIQELSKISFRPNSVKGCRRVICIQENAIKFNDSIHEPTSHYTALYESHTIPEKFTWDDWQSSEQVIMHSMAAQWITNHLRGIYETQ